MWIFVPLYLDTASILSAFWRQNFSMLKGLPLVRFPTLSNITEMSQQADTIQPLWIRLKAELYNLVGLTRTSTSHQNQHHRTSPSVPQPTLGLVGPFIVFILQHSNFIWGGYAQHRDDQPVHVVWLYTHFRRFINLEIFATSERAPASRHLLTLVISAVTTVTAALVTVVTALAATPASRTVSLVVVATVVVVVVISVSVAAWVVVIVTAWVVVVVAPTAGVVAWRCMQHWCVMKFFVCFVVVVFGWNRETKLPVSSERAQLEFQVVWQDQQQTDWIFVISSDHEHSSFTHKHVASAGPTSTRSEVDRDSVVERPAFSQFRGAPLPRLFPWTWRLWPPLGACSLWRTRSCSNAVTVMGCGASGDAEHRARHTETSIVRKM